MQYSSRGKAEGPSTPPPAHHAESLARDTQAHVACENKPSNACKCLLFSEKFKVDKEKETKVLVALDGWFSCHSSMANLEEIW